MMLNENILKNKAKLKRKHVTTIDNPFDPFKDFTSWFMFDVEKGYYTCSKLARLTKTTEEMTESQQEQAFEEAMKRLIEIDPLNIYIIIEEK